MFDCYVQSSIALLGEFRLREADDRCGPAQEPEWSNQEINGVSEEGRLIAFDSVSDELQYPARDEQPQRPTPVEKEERQRDDDERNADAVRQTVQRMLVFGFVVSEEIL